MESVLRFAMHSDLALVALAVAVLIVILALPRAERASAGAGWASRGDLRRAGLLSGRGILLGRWRGRLVRAPGETHVLLAAPTRSGKGVGFVVPNLLDWPGSVVALDIKGENFAATAGFRGEHGQEVFRFAPGEACGDRWNPLAAVSAEPESRLRDVLRLATGLFPVCEGRDEFWAVHARDLFAGAVLAVLEARGGEASLGDVRRFLCLPDLAEIVTEDHARECGRERDGSDRLLAWASTGAPATRSGILASARERLSPWGEPLLDAATSGSDFDFDRLRRRPTSLYVTVSPSDLERLAHVLRFFFEQLVETNSRGGFGAGTPYRVPLLLMLDEFTSIGHVPGLERSIAFVAAYGVRVCIVAQSEAQLRRTCGERGAQALIDNCAHRLLFAPASAVEAEAMSRLLGTRMGSMRSSTGSAGGLRGRVSVTHTQTERPLLRPEELRTLRRDRVVVVSADCRPAMLRRIRWYRDGSFRSRRRSPPASTRAAAEVRGEALPRCVPRVTPSGGGGPATGRAVAESARAGRGDVSSREISPRSRCEWPPSRS